VPFLEKISVELAGYNAVGGGIHPSFLPSSTHRRWGQPRWGVAVWLPPGSVRYAVEALRGVWRSLVARFVRDEEVVGSNPATPTAFTQMKALIRMTGSGLSQFHEHAFADNSNDCWLSSLA
jgi:hypothetical protein